MSDFEYMILELESVAERRLRDAEDCPHDSRNREAAKRLLKIATELDLMAESEVIRDVTKLLSDAVEIGGDDLEERLSSFPSRIGFDCFPDNAADYLREVGHIARKLLGDHDEESKGRSCTLREALSQFH